MGTPAHAIVGGAEDGGSLARSSVMVLSSKGGVCTAVVVARDAVLTAGHCAVGAGEHRVYWRGDDGAPVLVTPAAKAVHPGYAADAVAARRRSIDLALIRLAQPLPARFETAALSATAAPAGSSVTFGGYGVARVGDGRSSGTFRTAALTAVEPYGPSRILVWAKGPAGVGVCQADSGGPVTQGGSDAVFAVAAWAAGVNGAGCGGLSQGVLLGPQREWIDRILSGWGRSAAWR
jgi:hypothetical protein